MLFKDLKQISNHRYNINKMEDEVEQFITNKGKKNLSDEYQTLQRLWSDESNVYIQNVNYERETG